MEMSGIPFNIMRKNLEMLVIIHERREIFHGDEASCLLLGYGTV
jgi:hypothetical protein